MTTDRKTFWQRLLMAGAQKAALDANLDILSQLETADELRFEQTGWGERRLNTGETLFETGDPADTLYLVASGTLSLSLEGQEIATITRGETIGESSVFFPKETRMGQITAAEPSRLFALPRARLLELRDLNPAQYLRHLNDALRDMSARLRHTVEYIGATMETAAPKGLNRAALDEQTPSDQARATMSDLLQTAGVAPDMIDAVIGLGTFRSASKGDALFLATDPGASLFAIIEGEVKILFGENTTAAFKQGDLIAPTTFVTPAPRVCSAIAETDALVWEADQSAKDTSETNQTALLEAVLTALRHQLDAANALAAHMDETPDTTDTLTAVANLVGWQSDT